MTTSKRAELLADAQKLICGDRDAQYGDPTDNMALFHMLAEPIWAAPDLPDPVRGALVYAMGKIARILKNPLHYDSYTDAVGYIAIAAEAAKAVRPAP